jgi:hypothetical protein
VENVKKTVVISTRVREEERDALNALCAAMDRSQSWVIAELIRQADPLRLQCQLEGNGSRPTTENDPVVVRFPREVRASPHPAET